jgi:hypothetical protein
VVSGNPLEGGEDNLLDYLNPKYETRNTKQIRMTKTVAPLNVTMRFDPLLLSGFMPLFSLF